MPQDVVMPQMGESIAEGTLTTWLKKVGEPVKRDEPLFEISTDKVDAEIPSPGDGVLLEIKVQPGQTVPINTVVAVIGATQEQPSAATAAPTAADTAATASAPTQPGGGDDRGSGATADFPVSLEERRRTKSSPVVRKIAAEHGIRISDVAGTGISGRVTKQDILAFVEHADTQAAATLQEAADAATVAMASVPAAYRARAMPGDRVEAMSTMRRKIAEHMVLSKAISPHVATVFDVDFSHVAALRAKHQQAWLQQHDVKLTLTAFIMKAVVEALRAHPVLNASIDDNTVIYHRDVNLGIAVALDWGLLVPVVRRADELNLLGLARRVADLAERARSKKLLPEEVAGGTFTVTNPGIFGPLFGVPVINQPQVAILGVGAIEKRPVVINDMIGIRTKGYLTLSFDHRLVDGAVADTFMAQLKKTLEAFDESHL